MFTEFCDTIWPQWFNFHMTLISCQEQKTLIKPMNLTICIHWIKHMHLIQLTIAKQYLYLHVFHSLFSRQHSSIFSDIWSAILQDDQPENVMRYKFFVKSHRKLQTRYRNYQNALLFLQQRYSSQTMSIPCLLMPRLLALPGHQQSRYWLPMAAGFCSQMVNFYWDQYLEI